MNFDIAYSGAVVQGVNIPLYSLRADGNFAAAYAAAGQTIRVTLTGYTQTSKRGNLHYQTTDGYWVYLPDGWSQVGTAAVNRYSQEQAQALVNQIIRNNETILKNNLLCARFANKLTGEQQAAVRELQSRLMSRNNALQAEGLTINVQKAELGGYAELSPYLDRLMSGEAIGLATWVVVVIAATVVAATATAAYFAYKNFADESEEDVKYSKELTKILTSKLTEEEYQQLLNETKGIVTKARIKQAIGSYWTVIKWAAIGFAGYMGYKFIRERV